ncbi:MAG: zinc-dependent alcohol dehydrogenase, partial [Candidatus Binatia bacterium]
FPPPPSCTGHELAGEVAATGGAARGAREGDRVVVEPLRYCGECRACRGGDYQLCAGLQLYGIQLPGGHAEYMTVPARALFPLPASLDFDLGSLAEPLAVSIHGLRLASIRPGDRVLVLGGGSIGLLTLLAARAMGAAEVSVVARHPHQQSAARALGAAEVFSDGDTRPLVESAESRPFDSVIEAVGGEAETPELASRCVRPGGTIVLVGVLSRIPAIHPLLLIMREIRIVGSITYGRAGTRADFELALDLLGRESAAARRLLTHGLPLDRAAEGYAVAADKTTGSIKVTLFP